VIRVAGVGLVATHPDYRGKGLMAKTAWDSINAFKSAGYDATFLTGIDNYYSRFGYVRSWPGQSYRIDSSDLSAIKTTGKLERFQYGQRPDLAELYNREHAGLTGTAVHPTFVHSKRPGSYEGYCWSDARGRGASGYLLADPGHDELTVLESAGDPDAVLRALAAIVQNFPCKRVKFFYLHARSRLALRLRRGNCEVNMSYRKDGAAMMRITNLRRTLEKMSTVFAQRLKNSELQRWKGALSIVDAREHVTLEIANAHVKVRDGGKSPHVIRAGEQVMQLIVGTHLPQETIDAGAMKLSGDAALLLPVLFPHEEPQMAMSDQV
jgi:hypothetical protein